MDRPRLIGYRIKSVLLATLMVAVFGTALGFFTSILDVIPPVGPMMRGIIMGSIIGSNIGFFE